MCLRQQVPAEARGVQSPGVGIIDDYVPSDMGAGNQTLVLGKAIAELSLKPHCIYMYIYITFLSKVTYLTVGYKPVPTSNTICVH